MTKPVKPGAIVMISGKLYVAIGRSKPGADRRHRLIVQDRDDTSRVYWAVAQHNVDRGPWKIEGEATLFEASDAVIAEVDRVMALSGDEIVAEVVAEGRVAVPFWGPSHTKEELLQFSEYERREMSIIDAAAERIR